MNLKSKNKFRFFVKFSYFAGILIFLFSVFCLSFAVKVEASCDNTYQAPGTSDPCAGQNVDVACSQYNYPWCQAASQGPAGLVTNFYTIALGLAAASAMGVLIYGAILWTVSGAVATKKDAMDWIWGAIWGFVLLIAAYLILYTINPSLVNLSNPTFPPSTQPTPTSSNPPAGSSVTSNDAQIRQALSQVSGGKITENGPESQTSLNGLRNTTIAGVISLWNSCSKCNLEISGGTESGHEPGVYSHANGFKLDLTPNTDLNNTIYSRISASCATPPPNNTNCGGIDGNTYRYEPNKSGSGGYHWDVCFQCGA